MERDIHVQHQCTVTEDIYGLPGAAFAKKALMQHTACQSGGEVMGHMFSDGLTYARAHVKKPLQSTSGQGIREGRPARRSQWDEVCLVWLHAGRHSHTSPSRHFLTWVALRESSWTFALALCKLMLQHGGKRVLTKQWNGSSCLPACCISPKGERCWSWSYCDWAEKIPGFVGDVLAAGWVQTNWPNSDAVMDRRTNTSVFVNVGMCCDTRLLLSLPMLECDNSWVTILMPWQHRKCQIWLRSNQWLVFRSPNKI